MGCTLAGGPECDVCNSQAVARRFVRRHGCESGAQEDQRLPVFLSLWGSVGITSYPPSQARELSWLVVACLPHYKDRVADAAGSLLRNNMDVEASMELGRHLGKTCLHHVYTARTCHPWGQFSLFLVCSWFDLGLHNYICLCKPSNLCKLLMCKLCKPGFAQSLRFVCTKFTKFDQNLHKVC